eukprot:TRINITY_DN12613_c0_g1_i1.p1 TRINITY_DN12613_c0_g1~~TRINITY_DN12613_c0_g1_i1.p1  ORF type:complete len:388 (+),score=133.31 TRINITY_DN12613_c0_g1_i1:105-1166(+)
MADQRSRSVVDDAKEVAQNIQKEGQRYGKMIDAAAERAPPKMVPYLKKAAPFFGMLIAAFEIVTPMAVSAGIVAGKFISSLPHNVMMMVTGLVLVFFGGMYPMLLSAYEAAKVCGGQKMVDALWLLYEQSLLILQESKKDDLVDDDGDGVKDVDQISSRELLLRKSKLVLRKCKPELIQSACGALYTSWIGIIASLRIEYARTIALAVSIGNMLNRPATKFGVPVLEHVIDRDYHSWISVIIDSSCKLIGITIAFFIRRVLSTVQSALRGGNMFADGVIGFLKGQGKLPEGFSTKDSWADEAVAWTLAFMGCYFQMFVIGYALPFPLSILLWPFDWAEGWLMWSATYPPPPAM